MVPNYIMLLYYIKQVVQSINQKGLTMFKIAIIEITKILFFASAFVGLTYTATILVATGVILCSK